MFERRSLKGPITLGVSMIVLVVLLIAAWVSITVLLGTRQGVPSWIYWVLLAVGSIILVCILLGVIAYLTLSVKAINLNRRQSNFIDSVTHELKSPIASLKLYLQTLTMRSVDEEQRAHFQRFMLDDLERLDQLINHLLEAGRVERGVLPSEDEEVRIDELLHLCAETVCLRYRVPLETVLIESPPLVLNTKPVQVDILFRNLIDNAVKYGGTPPEVIVRANQPISDRLVISVLDNGPGIPPKLRRKIFGRFVRLGSELERSQPGTGLGLYLVRNIVRALQGSVRVHDRKDRPGTVFEVTIPGVTQRLDSDSKENFENTKSNSSASPGSTTGGERVADVARSDGEDDEWLSETATPAGWRLSRFRFPWYETTTRRAGTEEKPHEQPDDSADDTPQEPFRNDAETER